MSDCCDFGGGQSVCIDGGGGGGGTCFSGECWGPSCYSVSSSSSFDSGISRSSSSSSSLEMGTSNLYASSTAGESSISRAATIDSRKSVTDLVQEGTFIQSNKTPRLDQNERAAGEPPKIMVSNESAVTPDYIVRQDGKVEVIGNPESGDKAHGVYRVQVEPGADQKVTDDLVKYLNDRIHQKEPSASVSLDAAPGLVSEDTQKLFTVAPPKNEEQPNPEEPPPEDTPDSSPSCPGGGDGPGPSDTSPPEDSPSDTPPDANPIPPDAPLTPKGPMDDILDAARLNSWDNNTIGALGAYEINMTNWFSSWLDDEALAELGNPPDFKKLGKALAKMKNNPKAKEAMDARLNNMREQGDTAGADRIQNLFNKLTDPTQGTFQENFGVFMNSQRPGGRNATGEEMATFMDKDMQKAIASSRISDIAHQANVKVKDLPGDQAAKLALAGALGHIPTDKEMSDYNQYVQAIRGRYKQPAKV